MKVLISLSKIFCTDSGSSPAHITRLFGSDERNKIISARIKWFASEEAEPEWVLPVLERSLPIRGTSMKGIPSFIRFLQPLLIPALLNLVLKETKTLVIVSSTAKSVGIHRFDCEMNSSTGQQVFSQIDALLQNALS